jgi:hypothetical protein
VSSVEAGPSIDADVAEKVMGWRRELYAGRFYWFGPYDGRRHIRVTYDDVELGEDAVLAFAEESDTECWSPSTDIVTAWQVVEHLFAAGWALNIAGERGPGRPWDVRYWKGGERGMAFADTAPLAICKAALIAVGATEKAPSV